MGLSRRSEAVLRSTTLGMFLVLCLTWGCAIDHGAALHPVNRTGDVLVMKTIKSDGKIAGNVTGDPLLVQASEAAESAPKRSGEAEAKDDVDDPPIVLRLVVEAESVPEETAGGHTVVLHPAPISIVAHFQEAEQDDEVSDEPADVVELFPEARADYALRIAEPSGDEGAGASVEIAEPFKAEEADEPVGEKEPDAADEPAEESKPSEEAAAGAAAESLPREPGPIGEVKVDIGLEKGEPVPNPAEDRFPPMADAREGSVERGWTGYLYHWEPSSLCHRPLYFEEVNLERYGYSCCRIGQPLLSGAHFFATVPILPYKMTVEPPRECVYTLGHYRPGNCVPNRIHRMPLKPKAGVVEAGVITGLIFAVP